MMSQPYENKQVQAWQFLVDDQGDSLLAAARECQPGDVAGISRLRKQWSADQVAAALELHEARRRAKGKFENADEIIADRIGVEQATGSGIARYKAQRLRASGVGTLTDLCCGIGGDAMAFAQTMNTLGIDLDPLKVWMAGRNAGCETTCGDALQTEIHSDAIHIDPARRDLQKGSREHAPSGWSPDGDALQALLARHPNAAVKMGPGIDPENLPFRPHKSEVEFISMDGDLKQAILWTGSLSTGRNRATRCSADGQITLGSHQPEPAVVREARWSDSWLHVPDPAIERARLLGLLCRDWELAEPVSGLGLLLSDKPARTPWLTPYRVVHQMSWRVDRIKDWLREHDAGQVEIRTRGRAINEVDSLRAEFSGDGDNSWTIFGLRLGSSRIAVVTYPKGQEGD